MKIDTNIIDELRKQKLVTIGFSLGKDSLACALILKELGVDFIPVYFYCIPGMGFINKKIEMYENYFNKKIVQLPHPMLWDMLRHQDFQTPEGIEYYSQIKFPKLTFEDLIATYLEDIGADTNIYDVVGMRAAESFNRRMIFKNKYPNGINHKKKKIYPIFNWKSDDVWKYLKEKKAPIPDDYKIWGRSFDNFHYQFIMDVKKLYPEDYEIIKSYFPLIDLEIFKYEKNHEYLGQKRN